VTGKHAGAPAVPWCGWLRLGAAGVDAVEVQANQHLMSTRFQLVAVKWKKDPGDLTSVTDRAGRILAWLVDRGVVEPMPTDCGIGELAHAPGPRALEVVLTPEWHGAHFRSASDFRTHVPNGMELTIHGARPELVCVGDDMPSFRCPSCKAGLDTDTVLAAANANPFLRSNDVTCPHCHEQRRAYDVAVEGGMFADLTMHFWEWWPLKASFVAELEATFGAPFRLFHDVL
jgi:hypothetical protein